MSTVTSVVLHYDEKAPVKSKKLDKKDKDESRFDLYTSERVYMLRSDGNSFFESNEWVNVLVKSAKRFNPEGYNKKV